MAGIEYLVNEVRQFIGEVKFSHNVHFKRLAPPLESAIFRIVQEALNNARLHARARHVLVSLVENDAQLRLEIVDDGVGFDPNRVGDEHFGLQGIRERARLLDGEATIDSAAERGTRDHHRVSAAAGPRRMVVHDGVKRSGRRAFLGTSDAARQPELGNRKVNDDAGHVDERGDERAGGIARIEAQPFEDQRQHRADQRSPEADQRHRLGDDHCQLRCAACLPRSFAGVRNARRSRSPPA